MSKSNGEWWNGGWQRWRRNEGGLEKASLFRKNDIGSVSLIQTSKGFWVDGEPNHHAHDSALRSLPHIKAERVRLQAIKPVCVAKQLHFGHVFEARDRENIAFADSTLVTHGYAFIGYHGTNKANLRSMFEGGLNPVYCGSGDGEARGSGFYVSLLPDMAMDYADSSTQAGDPLPPRFDTIPRYEGEKGQPELARVYAKNFDTFKIGRDIAWGVESSDGDPGGDRAVRLADTTEPGLKMNGKSLEMVISPSRYPELAILPSLYSVGGESQLSKRTTWPNHKLE